MNEKTERAEGTPEPPPGGGEPKPPLAEGPNREDLTGRPDNYPRMVFRPGHMARVMGRYDVDYMTVGSEKALQDAVEHGWFLDPEKMGEPEPKTEADKRRKQERERQEKENEMGDKRTTGRGLKGGSGERDTRETNPEHVFYDPYKDPGNPRPGEPDNAPFRNTPYDEPQTGDLADPPTSPAEQPEREELDPVIDDQKEAEERSGGTPGLEADEDKLERDKKTGELKGLDELKRGGGGARDDRRGGDRIETDAKSREKAADKLRQQIRTFGKNQRKRQAANPRSRTG